MFLPPYASPWWCVPDLHSEGVEKDAVRAGPVRHGWGVRWATVLPGRGGPPPILVGVLALMLHLGVGGVQAHRAARPLHAPGRLDLGPRLRVTVDQPQWPRVTRDIAIKLLVIGPIRLPSLHAPHVGKRADGHICGEERDYTASCASGAVAGFARSLAGIIGGGYSAHRSSVSRCEALWGVCWRQP
jgi:hypothetical protein